MKPVVHPLGLHALARPATESSPVSARNIGVAGISLLLLAVAGCGLLVVATRFERGGVGG